MDIVECKINPDRLGATAAEAFRALYPDGENYVVSPAVKSPVRLRRGKLVFTACNTGDFPL